MIWFYFAILNSFRPEFSLTLRKREISELEEEILTLQKQFNSEQTPCNEEKLTYLDQTMEKLKSRDLTDEELNELYKTIIDHITWRREGNTIEVEVHFI